MNKVKRILAIVLAMAMVMAMNIVSFAAEITEAPKATASVKGVTEVGAVVTAYQLVTYNAAGGYEVVNAAKALGYEVGMRDASVVAALAQNTTGLSATTLTRQENGDYTAQLTAGTYLVLVTESGSTIYNPMLVSLEVSYPDGVQDGQVDADTDYVVDDETVYAKSTTDVPFDKKITDAEGNPIGENGKYEDVYSGTTVNFTLTGMIPSYSASYTNATYTLTDTASAGLTLESDVQADISSQVGSAAVVTVKDNTITIAYTTEYILAHGGDPVKITYSATVNGTASNFNAATNTLNVEYSNSPSTTTEGTEIITRHYTFDLSDELVKVDANNQEIALSGAEFLLTSTSDSTKTFTSTSDKNGNIAFKGLDAGEYTLEETKAPAGYELSGKKYTVKIIPSYDDNNVLTSYRVLILDLDGETETEIGSMIHTAGEVTGESAKILNTTLSELPSTGGIGTTIFTVVGCLIMIAAAAMFFVSRRKAEK